MGFYMITGLNDNTNQAADSVVISRQAAALYKANESKSVAANPAGAVFSKDTIRQGRYGNASYGSMNPGMAEENLKNSKNYMVVMGSTVSDDDFKKLMDEGYEPGDMSPEEIVTIVDEIKATLAKSGTVIAGYNDNLGNEVLENITGSAAYASKLAQDTAEAGIDKASPNAAASGIDKAAPNAAASGIDKSAPNAAAPGSVEELGSLITEAFAYRNVPVTQKNVESAALAMAMSSELKPIDDAAAKYLVVNDLELSIANIYKAEHAGATDALCQGRGYFSDGAYMGYKADESFAENTKEIERVLEEAGYETDSDNIKLAAGMIEEGIPLTGETFGKAQEIKDIKLPVGEAVDKRDVADAIARSIKLGRGGAEALLSTKARIVEEVRLSMTISSVNLQSRAGVNIDTDYLKGVVEELKEAENRQFEALFGETYGVDKDKAEELVALYRETNKKVSDIAAAPAMVVASFTMRSSFTVNDIYEAGEAAKHTEITNEYTYKLQALQLKYEPLMTEVRPDLGDNIKKAFSSVDNILNDMGIEATDDVRKAVRILGYNGMEITEDSIDRVRKADNRITGVIARMKPARVLDLIKKGNNPLEMSFDELETRLDEIKLTPVQEAERLGRFMMKLEKSPEISSEQRAGFLGIYRMIHAIEKDDGAAAGLLLNMQGDINFKNLMTAARIRKNKGIDEIVDNNAGGIDSEGYTNSITGQIDEAFDEFRKIAELPKMESLLTENGIENTLNNIIAINELFTNRGSIYKEFKKLSDKSTKGGENVDNSVDEEGNDSFINKFLDSLKGREEAKSGYEDMMNVLESRFSAALDSADNSLDVRSLALNMKIINVSRALAGEEWYEVPMNIGGEETSISLKVRSGMEKNVSIYFESSIYGRVNASFDVADTINNGLTGIVTSDNRAGIASLKEKAPLLMTNLGMAGITAEINYIQSSKAGLNIITDIADKNISSTSKGIEVDNGKDADLTKMLYNTARIFLRTVGES